MSASLANESNCDRCYPIHDVFANDDHYDEYGAYLPTPRQIEQACLQIQQEWTPRERRRRYAGDVRDLIWDLPFCRLQNAS